MKRFISCFILFSLLTVTLSAQWNRIIAYGDTNNTSKCFDGCIDSWGNQILAYTDDQNFGLSVASFDSWHAKNWSFRTNKDVSGETHVQQLLDGNYLISYNEMYSGGLMKLDTAGNIIWQKSYLDFVFEAVVEDTNDDLYVCGAYGAYGFVSCLDDTGGVRWIVKNDLSSLYKDVIFTLDGKLALTGTRFGSNQETDFVFSKVSKTGTEVWTKNYSYSQSLVVQGLVQSPIDFCFYMTGYVTPSSNMILGSRIMYMKCDSSGQVIGTRVMGYQFGNYGHDIIRTEGNNFILAGSSRPQQICGGTNLVLVKFNSNLDTIMTRRYGDASGMNMTVYQLKKYAPNQNYLFMHAYTWSVFSYSDAIHVRTDTMLTVPCDNLYFPMQKTEIVVTQYPGSTFSIDSVAIGSGLLLNPSVVHAADACTNALLNVSETQIGGMHLYPNPADRFIRIDNVNYGTTYSVYNMLGEEMLNGNYNGREIDISALSPGVYLLQISQGDRISTARFIAD
ncbi:MAG: hypothetical protein RL007_278 [Bacteroidota bacterium]|jgi:hypothetical protein